MENKVPKKHRSWREGVTAAKEGTGISSCPYQLDENAIQILIKRDRWIKGWESIRYKAKSPSQIEKRKKQLVSKTSSYGLCYYLDDEWAKKAKKKKLKKLKRRKSSE